MADKDLGKLELPSFLGGRKKPKPTPEPEPVAAEPKPTPDPEPVAAEPKPTPDPEPVAVEPKPTPEPEPVAVEPKPTPEPVSEPTPEPRPASTRTLPAAGAAGVPVAAHTEEPEATEEPAPRRKAKRERKPRKPFRLPAVGPAVAAAVTGLVAGLLVVCLTYLTMEGCSLARGTSSCGGSGFFALLVIVVLVTWLSSLALRAWRVAEPGTTALLGMGLLIVVALLFLIDLLFEWWMIIVIPVVGLLTYVLSHAVGAAFTEDKPASRPQERAQEPTSPVRE